MYTLTIKSHTQCQSLFSQSLCVHVKFGDHFKHHKMMVHFGSILSVSVLLSHLTQWSRAMSGMGPLVTPYGK